MTIENLDTNICSGCSLCARVCPKNSITMQPDREGFLHPLINHNTCIDCGLCYKKCPSKKEDILPSSNSKYYAININDRQDLQKSSSGGVFIVLAKKIINDG
jgi:ferredoxin